VLKKAKIRAIEVEIGVVVSDQIYTYVRRWSLDTADCIIYYDYNLCKLVEQFCGGGGMSTSASTRAGNY
jgi:hypothetical protein